MQRMLKVMMITISILLQQIITIDAGGDWCITKNQVGECKERVKCPIIQTLIKNGQYTTQDVVSCGFDGYTEFICCPTESPSQRTIQGERPAARACRRIEGGLIRNDNFYITNGISTAIADFPHMAAIGFSPVDGPFNIICGGSLIDKRFVLTAAHCFEISDHEAVIVRLGVTNFSDPVEMRHAVEIKIKTITEHPEYNIRYKYNDIAIVELERDVETSEFIYPVCLYMNETDPDPEIELLVTGWGRKRKIGRAERPDSLMKASLSVIPMDDCDKIFMEYGYTAPIPHGITNGIFCAKNIKKGIDACEGDSGGPLNLVVNEKFKNYRVVGIVNSGISCGGRTPGLYTKVATFLDFIESIVWPDGGD